MRQARSQEKNADTARLQSQLEDVRLQYAVFQTNLYAAHPEVRIKRGESEPVKTEEAQQLLDTDTTLLEYVLSEDKLFLFVCPGGGPSAPAAIQAFTIPIEERQLSTLVDQFRGQLANRDLAFRAAAKRLYQLVLAPVRPYIKGSGKLLIVPDGVLWELPFQALIDPAGHYLLDDHVISYAPSLTAWKSMNEVKKQRRQNRRQTELLAMGNP